MSNLSQVFVALFSGIVLLIIISYRRTRRANPCASPLPPGPRPLPIIGNVHQAPKDHDWLRYTEWARQYGPIVHFRLFQQPVILLNTQKVTIDLFERRSGIYSDRPMFIMAGELMGWDRGVALGQSGQRHRKYRRLINSVLNPVAARKIWPLQEAGSYKFLSRLINNPDQFCAHIRASVSETIVMVAFGHECSADAFPYIEMAERVHEKVTLATSPSAYLVDSLPILRHIPHWFPGATFKKQARLWNAELQELVQFPYETVKADLENGTAHPSYVAHHIDKDEPLVPDHEEHVMWSAASLYTGGVDTSTAAVITFILAMCLNPQVQTKAQQELDRLIGQERLPTIADREHLPYLDACLKEVLRWHPVAPLGVSHRASQNDYYEGYYIPKGATVVSNIWAMTRDESIYPSPEEFRPERFLPPGEGQNPDGIDPGVVFGFGRRVCPGMHMADSSLFIYMASTLATFTISKMQDSLGRDIEPEVDFVSGLISHPRPFKCAITVRSEKALQLIKESEANASKSPTWRVQ